MPATSASPQQNTSPGTHTTPVPCRHCGEPADAGAVHTDDGVFCCEGCHAVFSLLTAHGLQAYYTCEVGNGTPGTRAAISQRNAARRDRGRFAVLDDPEVAARFIETDRRGMARVTFPVPAMHCASCIWLLEQLWRFDAGIVRSEADLLRRTVRVAFDPARTTLRAVAERLASLGYEPVLDPERTRAAVPAARREIYLKIGLAGFAFGNVMLFSIPRYVNGAPLDPAFQRLFDTLNILFALPVLFYSASDYFRAAWRALRARASTLDIPVALGLAVLFLRSIVEIASGRGEGFLDSFSGLVLFLLIGKLFQQKAFDRIAFDRTVRSFFPLSVRVERGAAAVLTPIEQLEPGDVVLLRPGEVVPADATLLDADAAIDYAFVTGEQLPVPLRRGDAVQAGGRVSDRAIRVRVDRPVSRSRLTELWNNPVFTRPKPAWLTGITAAFAWWFTVLALAIAAAGAIAWWPDVAQSAAVATAVLIIACPCALTLSAPITLGTAMGALGRAGCYLKHAGVALDLSRVDTIAFDKTGTLTTATAQAQPECTGLDAARWALVRRLAAHSAHPVSRAIAGTDAVRGDVVDVREQTGEGLSGLVAGRRVVLGSAAFVARETGLPIPTTDERTCAAVDGEVGWVRLTTPERPGMAQAAAALAASHEMWLLSGDHAAEASRWRGIFGDRMRFRQTPDGKLAAVRERQAAGRRVLMVGDGLNDAGALAAADVGLAVSDDTACLVPACDAVIQGDRLASLPAFLAYARRAKRVVMLCFAVSIIYNVVGLSFALAGQLTPLVTAILMPVSSLTIVGLSVGLMRRGPLPADDLSMAAAAGVPSRARPAEGAA